MSALLVALVLAGTAPPQEPQATAPGPAHPGDPTVTSPVQPAEPAGAVEARPEAESAYPDPSGWRHSIGIGPHVTSFVSREGSPYNFRSAAFGYLGSVGRRGAFLNAFWLVPLQARQDGNTYPTGDRYRTRAGADFLLGFNMRFPVARDMEAEAGPGLHATVLYLLGKPGYRDFTASPMGLGAGGTLTWRTSARGLSRPVTVGFFASLSYDFRDPLHDNDIDHGFTFRAGVSVGLGGVR